jgi:GTPase
MQSNALVTPELAAQLTALSHELNRVVGVLVDRRGRVDAVAVGDARRLYLPDPGRARGAAGRLRGLRLIRARLGSARGNERLTNDDLTDLSKLSLDAVATIDVLSDGRPGCLAWAHLVAASEPGPPWRIEQVDHVSRLTLDFPAFLQALEDELADGHDSTREVGAERAMLVYVRTREDYNHTARLAELRELCRTVGVEVAESFVQSRMTLDPKFAVGSGAIEEIELRALQLGAELLIFGQDLTPAQVRSISERTSLRVIDRSQLILDIFAKRAQSRVGQLQVELAQLKYRLPRLSGRGTAMSRLAGGIGGRGPGETKLEIDRRRARDRITALERAIERLRGQRELRRRGRRIAGLPIVSIVGYTNAGKSTLLNTLTQSTVLSEDKLFATLDPTSRRLRFPQDREIILTDTVGFIRDLPDELREAFRATLEELQDADILLHIVDASDPNAAEHIKSTERILADLGLQETPRLLVFNKADRCDADTLATLAAQYAPIFVSALRRDSTRPLIEALDRWLIEHGHADAVPRPDALDPAPSGHDGFGVSGASWLTQGESGGQHDDDGQLLDWEVDAILSAPDDFDPPAHVDDWDDDGGQGEATDDEAHLDAPASPAEDFGWDDDEDPDAALVRLYGPPPAGSQK